MDIPFNFKILNVNREAANMLVEYSAEGYETVVVGMPIPRVDVTLEHHLEQYKPTFVWVVQKLAFHNVQEGHMGTVVPSIKNKPEALISDEDIKKLIDQIREE